MNRLRSAKSERAAAGGDPRVTLKKSLLEKEPKGKFAVKSMMKGLGEKL